MGDSPRGFDRGKSSPSPTNLDNKPWIVVEMRKGMVKLRDE